MEKRVGGDMDRYCTSIFITPQLFMTPSEELNCGKHWKATTKMKMEK
jgi:hypothetical protein